MSPRRIRRRPPPAGERPPGPERTESWPDGDWIVRPVAGASTAKAYRCPGCDQEIPPGTPHIVAWPADGPADALADGPTVGSMAAGRMAAGVTERRHWHRPCWEHRLRRRR